MTKENTISRVAKATLSISTAQWLEDICGSSGLSKSQILEAALVSLRVAHEEYQRSILEVPGLLRSGLSGPILDKKVQKSTKSSSKTAETHINIDRAYACVRVKELNLINKINTFLSKTLRVFDARDDLFVFSLKDSMKEFYLVVTPDGELAHVIPAVFDDENVEIEIAEQPLLTQSQIDKLVNFYRERVGKTSAWQFTKTRSDKLMARAAEAKKRSIDPYDYCHAIIDYVTSEPFWMGENERGKRFVEWEQQLFNSEERAERHYNSWLERKNGRPGAVKFTPTYVCAKCGKKMSSLYEGVDGKPETYRCERCA